MTDITIEVKEESSTCCGGSGQCGCKAEEKAEVKTETSCCGGNCQTLEANISKELWREVHADHNR